MHQSQQPAPQALGEVLEKRVVAIDEVTQTSLEWHMALNADGNKIWKPYQVDLKTGTTISGKPLAWAPLPGSQFIFLSCPIFEALYEGTRGPGKTITLLLDFAREVGKGYGNSWRGILFRKTFGDLDDVVKKIEENFYNIFPGFKFLKSKSEYKAVWPTGEELLLRHMDSEADYPQYHGHEYPWIGWEELTQWEDDKAYRVMFSCCRSAQPGIPKRVRSTTNPYGPGHNWVKKRWQLGNPARGVVIKNPGEVARVAIHGNLSENFLLLTEQPEYPQIIMQAAVNPAQGKAWLHGDWNVSAGGMIDDVWDAKVNIIPSFSAKFIPQGWTITRAYDHGQSHPFSCGWWLESNGEGIRIRDHNGDWRWIGNVRGDLIRFGEWYGSTGKPNEGLRMSAPDVARGILEREEDLGIRRRCKPGPADTEIWSKDQRGTGLAPADDMDKVYDPPYGMKPMFYKADKTPGSRVRGWQMLRSRVRDAQPEKDGSRSKPGIFICDNCHKWLELVPVMPRDPKNMDDVPEKYEDHNGDETRYRLNWELPSVAVQHNTF